MPNVKRGCLALRQISSRARRILVSLMTSRYFLPNTAESTRVPTILIIDDEELICELIVSLLQGEGYNTLAATDGRRGIELARTHLPDLIICDVTMPSTDGHTTLRTLRQDPSTATIPFIFLSGHTGKSDMRQGMDMGADDYLAKPVVPDDLVAAVKSRLQKREMNRKETERKLNELRMSLSLTLPHEIRTPLSGIIGFAEILRDDSRTLKPEEISEMASMILKSSQRLGVLMENALTFAQLQILSASPDKGGFAGSEATSSLRTHLEEAAQRKCASMERLRDLHTSLASAEAVISLQSITRILEELLDNAGKFSKPGTPIGVTSRVEGDAYVLEIRDEGVGMNSTQLGEIGAYRQFGRTSREQQGTGLGLTISKMIAELYEGQLSVTSEPGKGTTVRVRIPVPPQT